ncbi:VC0807 family protein [Mycobacteroides salmoniphilum]|uniref:VC0807 family protein n=1 Tax=Mycobacteroides salmoniphilum TaxID=404941 RepID=UPI000991B456|nr:VC0807 family protein [Mycobacteroides salmoniphilum]QCH24673.1 hypothetical protein DSM43276_02941 [Mycobacteroides salmoniphilum]
MQSAISGESIQCQVADTIPTSIPSCRTSHIAPAALVSKPPAGTTKSRIRHALVSAGLGLGTYYGTRLAGASELHALIAAAAVSAVRVIYTIAKDRRFDLIAGFIMLTHGATLIVALYTGSPELAQLTRVAPLAVAGLFFIASGLLGRPLTQIVVAKILPLWIQQRLGTREWEQSDHTAYRRMHIWLCLAVGVIYLAQALLMTTVIHNNSADVAQLVNKAVSTVSEFIRLAFAIGTIWLFRQSRQKTPT